MNINAILEKAVNDSASDVFIIAGLPVSVNIGCHATRHAEGSL